MNAACRFCFHAIPNPSNYMKSKRKTSPRCLVALPLAAAFVFAGTAAAMAGYPETILSNNPAAYYRLEEPNGSGPAADSSGNGFDGVYVSNSGSTSPQWGLPGVASNSIAVNGGTVGDNGFVLIPYHPEL